MQKTDGTPGKGMTAAEFMALSGKLLAEARERSAGDPECFPLGRIIVSLDNVSYHKRFQRSKPANCLNVIPSRSPDIHKVVEHPLKPFNSRFYAAFTRDLKCTTCEAAMKLASDCLHQTTADSIWRDVQTLPDTLRSVIRNRGDWADDDLC